MGISEILVAVVCFVAAIDQFSLTEVFYRPIILGPILGAILGDINMGLSVGGMCELANIGAMPVGGAQPANVILWVVMGTTFAKTVDPETALSLAVPFSVLGTYCVVLVFTVNSFFMAVADKAAAAADPKKIVALNWGLMCLLGVFFAVVCVAGLVGGAAAGPKLNEFFATDFGAAVMGGLQWAGGAMRLVGFAVLLKIMLSADYWGFLLAGFAGALIINGAGLGGAGLVIIAMIGFAIAFYDFGQNIKIKN
jgi:PTS system N-acetylgalactosamine-specific IIC component